MPGPDSYTDRILQDLEANENGYFQIENSAGKAILKITKPGPKGKKVDYKDVLARVQLFGVEGYNSEQIKRAVALAENKPVEIGTWSKGDPIGSYADITISEDLMEAKMVLHPPKHGGALLSEYQLREQIASVGISVGIIDSVIQNQVKNPDFFVPYTIAKGYPPIPGKDGEIKIYFRSDNKPQLEEDEHGRIDYKNIGVIQSVKPEDLIAERIPPKKGEFGKTVNGSMIPYQEEKTVDWNLGPNVELRGDKLYAKIAGRPVLSTAWEIKVDEVIQLEAVDYSTGNIDFPGTIIVEEKIGDGFSLTTSGSIIIRNSVGKAFLKAKGDIVLSGGFMGRGEGYIESEGNIYAKFVEQGKLTAQGSIFVEEAVMHSELSAKDFIRVVGGRGEVIGGTVIAGNSLTCAKLGAVVETKTKVAIGTPPELLDELNRMKKEIADKEITLHKVQLTLTKLVEKSQKKDLTLEEKETITKLKDANEKFTKVLEAQTKQFETALGSYEPNPEAYVDVEREVFPGVDLSFGAGKNYRMGINSLIGKTHFYLGTDGSIQTDRTVIRKED
ncbi:PF03961 family protein [Leptospira wolbachii serovar Codice str. CDC]|uniref:PF03961 family protein n=1 Tax=Leptospira wolbachii serovar Codice str. CDC TaxID=1218599 RepID=R9A3C2_9LEPT|nr:FapA family protein [Leptospira wolbachii]EOQ96504.1 PF03961 family protein [Leptospira wolbachii serovar Codice str. CDC]